MEHLVSAKSLFFFKALRHRKWNFWRTKKC